jgi:uncharacterized SAM-binding protein YcdF (DUF218 family)
MVVLCFTDKPFWTYYWLGTKNASFNQEPEVIIMLGGSGMPSPSGLMRTFYAARLANTFDSVPLYIAMPARSVDDTTSSLFLVKNELVSRGVDQKRIKFEIKGYNTYTQAINMAHNIGEAKDSLMAVLVTSPEHMYRSVLTYRKAGFKRVGGYSSFSSDIAPDLLLHKEDKDDTIMKRTEQNLDLRYNLWAQFKYEILILREFMAIGYYKLKGWI